MAIKKTYKKKDSHKSGLVIKKSHTYRNQTLKPYETQTRKPKDRPASTPSSSAPSTAPSFGTGLPFGPNPNALAAICEPALSDTSLALRLEAPEKTLLELIPSSEAKPPDDLMRENDETMKVDLETSVKEGELVDQAVSLSSPSS